MHMQDNMTVSLTVPLDLEPKLERQIKEYNHLRELGEQMNRAGLLDPTTLC